MRMQSIATLILICLSTAAAMAEISSESCSASSLTFSWNQACVCKRQVIKANWAEKKGKELDSYSWGDLRDEQVVFIGDEHGYSDPKAILNLITRLKPASKKKCLLFEMASSKSVKEFTDMLVVRSGDKEIDRLRDYYNRILQGAKNLGLTPQLVDHPQNLGDQSLSDHVRDKAIAENIISLFKTGKCDHAVMVIGKAHVGKEYFGSKNAKQLVAAKLSATSINLMFAKETTDTTSDYSWNGLCSDKKTTQFTPKKPIIFANSGISEEQVFPNNSSFIRYGAFDYTVMFPTSTFK